MPLGEEELTEARRQALLEFVLDHAERMVPGLQASLLYRRVVSPAEFRSFHGLSSAPLPRLPRSAFQRPDNLDPATGIYHVGVSVPPPGNDGTASVVCGRTVADRILELPSR
jgi:phytoene dehydrogenase-like protein